MRAALIVLAAAFILTGCVAYDVASTAVSVTGTVVSTTADVAGAIVTAPFGHDSDSEKHSDK